MCTSIEQVVCVTIMFVGLFVCEELDSGLGPNRANLKEKYGQTTRKPSNAVT